MKTNYFWIVLVFFVSNSFSKSAYHESSLYDYNILLKSANKFQFASVDTGHFIKGKCVNGKIEGPVEIFNRDSTLFAVGNIQDGILNGKTIFFSSKTKDTIMIVTFTKGFITGNVKMWYLPSGTKSGKLKLDANYLNGRLHGKKKSWTDKGRIQSVLTYDNGKLLKAKGYNFYGRVPKDDAIRAAKNMDLMDVRYYGTVIGTINSLISCDGQ